MGSIEYKLADFLNCYDKLMDNGIAPTMIYNVDETGITCVQKPIKIIAKKGTKQVGRLTSAERGKTVTVVCAMSASGNYIPPLFIFPRKRMHMPLMKGAPVGSQGYASPSGWIDSKIFLEWFRHFKSFVQPSADRKFFYFLTTTAVTYLSLQLNMQRKITS